MTRSPSLRGGRRSPWAARSAAGSRGLFLLAPQEAHRLVLLADKAATQDKAMVPEAAAEVAGAGESDQPWPTLFRWARRRPSRPPRHGESRGRRGRRRRSSCGGPVNSSAASGQMNDHKATALAPAYPPSESWSRPGSRENQDELRVPIQQVAPRKREENKTQAGHHGVRQGDRGGQRLAQEQVSASPQGAGGDEHEARGHPAATFAGERLHPRRARRRTRAAVPAAPVGSINSSQHLHTGK